MPSLKVTRIRIVTPEGKRKMCKPFLCLAGTTQAAPRC